MELRICRPIGIEENHRVRLHKGTNMKNIDLPRQISRVVTKWDGPRGHRDVLEWLLAAPESSGPNWGSWNQFYGGHEAGRQERTETVSYSHVWQDWRCIASYV